MSPEGGNEIGEFTLLGGNGGQPLIRLGSFAHTVTQLSWEILNGTIPSSFAEYSAL